jgi:hypothetical protein
LAGLLTTRAEAGTAMWKWFKEYGLHATSAFLAAYFFIAFIMANGFPPRKPLDATSTSYLVLFVFFLLLPSARKLKLGKILEYEAKVREIKEGIDQFKAETRELISIQNGFISSFNVAIRQNQAVNNNFYLDPGEYKRAQEQITSTVGEGAGKDKLNAETERLFAEAGSDPNYALAILRMQLEKELRRTLGKQGAPLDVNQASTVKSLSARSLFSLFTEKYPKYRAIEESFAYVMQICNAGIHGRSISDDDTQAALEMGIRILDALKKIAPSGA